MPEIGSQHGEQRRGAATTGPPIHIRTLADVDGRHHLYAHCNQCRHARRLDVPLLLQRFGALTFRRLRRRLRCTRCGARSPEVMHVWDNGAG